ncbi:MAG: helix-turn-helix transcriptional regulator [Treponema sp.]|nr:helix-turn-helix transcriptional regulator [Treponema sp.]
MRWGSENEGVINVKTTYFKPVLDLNATGAKIKTIMKQKGMSPRRLQVIMDFPYVQTIYNWFAGKNMPTIDNLVVLASVLGVSMDELVVTKLVETVIGDREGEILSA